MIKALIFDFYGVIRSDEYHDWLVRHDIKRDSDSKSAAKSLNKGLTTVDQFFESLSKVSDIPAAEIKEEFLSHASLNKQLLSLILKLKENYKIALLSNASSSYLREVLNKAGINKLFDEVIISSELGLVKPSSEIFDYALSKLSLKPDEVVFIDDNQSFVDAAEKLGIKSVAYCDYDSLVSNFEQMGIMEK